jgi:hypothetical protein
MIFKAVRAMRLKLRRKFSNHRWYISGKSIKNKTVLPIFIQIQILISYVFRLMNISYYNGREITFRKEGNERVLLRTGFAGPFFLGKKIIFSSRRLRRRNNSQIINNMNVNCYSDDGHVMVASSFLESLIRPDGKLELTKLSRVVRSQANFLINPNSSENVFVPKISGFFHFYIQLVPLLLRCQDRYKIQIDLDLAEENFEILDYFGIGLTKINESETARAFLFTKIVKQQGLYPSIEDVHLLNLFHKERALDSKPNKNLFISRSGNTNGRHVTNEKDVLKHLEPFGFERVDPGKLSFTEQTNLFAQAQNIVAPHGAALSHLVVVPSTCNVIELNSPANVRWHFRKMSTVLNLKHTLIIGKKTVGSDFSIDPHAIIKHLLI